MHIPDVHAFPFPLSQTSSCSMRVRPGSKNALHGEPSSSSTLSALSSPCLTSLATPSRIRPLLNSHSPKNTAFCACASHRCAVCSRISNGALALRRSRSPPILGLAVPCRGPLSSPYARVMGGAAPLSDFAVARKTHRRMRAQRMRECARQRR